MILLVRSYCTITDLNGLQILRSTCLLLVVEAMQQAAFLPSPQVTCFVTNFSSADMRDRLSPQSVEHSQEHLCPATGMQSRPERIYAFLQR